MNNQSSIFANPEEVDVDIEADVTKVGRWVTDQEKFNKELCNKLGVKYSTSNRKAREMRQSILRKIEELSMNGLLKKIEELFNEKVLSIQPVSSNQESLQMISAQIKDEEIRRLTRENSQLLQEIENLNQSIEVYNHDVGHYLLKNGEIFSAEVAASLTRSLKENKGEIFGVQRIIIDHVNKKLIVEYDISGDAVANIEQGVTKENQERFIKTFSRYMKQLLDQNELLLKLVTEFKDFIHFEDNCEEENIKLEKEELQRKEESLKYLYELISEQNTFSEIVGVLDGYYNQEVNDWNNGYEGLKEVYYRLLNKTKEMTTEYEKMITDYLVGEDNIQI